jgi:hypothetical protein
MAPSVRIDECLITKRPDRIVVTRAAEQEP